MLNCHRSLENEQSFKYWGGVSPDPIVKAVLEAIGGAYIVEQGQVPFTKVNQSVDTPIYYRKWSNGFIEQWQGRWVTNRSNEITFPIPFSNTEYALIGPGFGIANIGVMTITKKTTGFNTVYNTNEVSSQGWYACGY